MPDWLCCLLAGLAGLSTGAASISLLAWQQQRQEQRQQQAQHQVQRQEQTQRQAQGQRQEQSATSVFRVEVQEGGNVNITPRTGEAGGEDERGTAARR